MAACCGVQPKIGVGVLRFTRLDSFIKRPKTSTGCERPVRERRCKQRSKQSRSRWCDTNVETRTQENFYVLTPWQAKQRSKTLARGSAAFSAWRAALLLRSVQRRCFGVQRCWKKRRRDVRLRDGVGDGKAACEGIAEARNARGFVVIMQKKPNRCCAKSPIFRMVLRRLCCMSRLVWCWRLCRGTSRFGRSFGLRLPP